MLDGHTDLLAAVCVAEQDALETDQGLVFELQAAACIECDVARDHDSLADGQPLWVKHTTAASDDAVASIYRRRAFEIEPTRLIANAIWHMAKQFIEDTSHMDRPESTCCVFG